MRGRSWRRNAGNAALRIGVLVAALPVAAGCGASLQPIDVTPDCPAMPLRGPAAFAGTPAERMVDDFEDDVAVGDLSLTRVAGRTGSWVGSLGTLPPIGATIFGEASTRCVASGTHSGHLTATGIPPYGASWTASLQDPTATPPGRTFDASAYSGISFWIAMGDGALPPFETPIGVTTTDTAPAGGICTMCGDYYAIRKRIPLTHTWTRWVVPFTDLAQYGFGVPQVPLRKDQLWTVIIWPESQFDIWIDDLRFEP